MRKHIALALGALLLGAAAPSAQAAGLPPMPELTAGGGDTAPIVEARWNRGHHYGWRHHRHWGYYRGWGPRYTYYRSWGPSPYYGAWQPRPSYGYGYGYW